MGSYHGADLALSDAVLHEEVGVEELASAEGLASDGVLALVIGLVVASLLAVLRLVRARGRDGEGLRANEGVGALAVLGGVDGAIEGTVGLGVARKRVPALAEVAVGGGNHNVEVVGALGVGGDEVANVGSMVRRDGDGPEGALDDSGGRRLGAILASGLGTF